MCGEQQIITALSVDPFLSASPYHDHLATNGANADPLAWHAALVRCDDLPGAIPLDEEVGKLDRGRVTRAGNCDGGNGSTANDRCSVESRHRDCVFVGRHGLNDLSIRIERCGKDSRSGQRRSIRRCH